MEQMRYTVVNLDISGGPQNFIRKFNMKSSVAFLFPGQGSQIIGMGAALADESKSAKLLFEQVNDAISEDLFSLMKRGPSEILQLTRNAQPAIFASSLAVVAAIEERFGDIEKHAAFVAGHSLGEYSALAASKCIETSNAARLLRIRGKAMQLATPVGTGAMAAMIGTDVSQIEELIAVFNASNPSEIVQIANDNSPSQVVVSGHKNAVKTLCEMGSQIGVKKSLMLPVSAPFHCDLMSPASKIMSSELAKCKFNPPQLKVFCNVTGSLEEDVAKLRLNLVAQVTARVRWRETIINLSENGVTNFVEIGTGKVLSGLVKRTIPNAQTKSLESFQDITNYFS